MPEAHIEFYNAAIDALQAGRPAAALEAIQQSLMEKPDDRESWLLNVAILQALGRKDEAERAKTRLDALGCPPVEGLLLAAGEAMVAGNPAAAIDFYRQALEEDPGHTGVLNALALALLEAGEKEQACEVAAGAVAGAPHEPESHYIHGRALRLAGRKDEAMKAFEQALALDAELPMALYEQAMLLAEAGRPELALRNLETFLLRNPDDANARQAVASLRASLTRTL
jgi:tetratricopeptide (TPR) repeat protein